MRHRTSGKKLGRTPQQRVALFRSLADGLVRHGRITTTERRAKVLQSYVERIASRVRRQTLMGDRCAQRVFQDSVTTKKFLETVKAFPRQSGFVSVVKTGIRHGDAARMAEVSWTRLI